MSKTKVVNIHHKLPYDIYIGRGKGSIWGNPFSHMEGTLAKYKCESREEAIERYREWILKQPDLLSQLHVLKGKTLGCFCHPSSCHGHVLASLANKVIVKQSKGRRS